jgi:hypothetical protein
MKVKAASKPSAAMSEGIPVARGRRFGNMVMPVLYVRKTTAAKMLSTPLARVNQMIERGELACVRFNDGTLRIPVRAIEQFALDAIAEADARKSA